MDGIRQDVIARQQELRAEFERAEPFRNLVVDNFLQPDFFEGLVCEFPSFESGQSKNELGAAGGKSVHTQVAQIGESYKRFDLLMQDKDFLGFLSEITGIPRLTYDAEYVGGGTHENKHGQDLDVHVDFNYHPRTRYHRRLNLILFLNREWEEGWGGVLTLLKDPSRYDQMRSVVPAANRMVLFETTEHSWHGFRRVTMPEDKQHVSRKSLAVYFYTRDRPALERAPDHGTIYIPQPVPEFVQAGHTLTAEEAHEIQLQFARRDEQIRFLYDRELEFGRIAGSPSFRLARVLTWPFRTIRAVVRPHGGSGKT